MEVAAAVEVVAVVAVVAAAADVVVAVVAAAVVGIDGHVNLLPTELKSALLPADVEVCSCE